MANFTKTTSYTAGNKVTTLTSTESYEQAISYDLIVDDADNGIKLLAVDPEARTTLEDWNNIKSLCVQCISKQPIEVVFKTTTWTDDDTTSGNDYFHTILTENQMIHIPNARLISYNGSGASAGNKTAATLVASAGVDAGINVAGSATGSTGTADLTDTDFLLASSGAAIFEVGDRITWDGSATYTVGDEIAEITNVDAAMLTLKRGQIFSDVDTWGTGNDVLFYWITDENGNVNWRSNPNDIDAGSKLFGGSFSGGIVPGSVNIRFYSKPYHQFGMTDVTSSTSTGLTAGSSYRLKVSIDGRDYDNVEFTVDSTNVNWGGTNSVISKIQTALDSNSVPATVALTGGDVVFTSKLGTNGGSIALAAPSGGTTMFGAGNIPAVTSLGAQIGSILDLNYGDDDFNQGKLMYDDGKGNLYRENGGTGTINYDTGQAKISGAPSYSQFSITFISDSPLDGKIKLDATNNYLAQVNARSLNTGKDAKVRVVGYY